jgi:hypothetical protein
MKISETHQRFANRIDNQRILLHLWHPENFLGPNWKDVLNFWLYLDTLSPSQLLNTSNDNKLADLVDSWNFYEEAAEETIGEDIYYEAYWSPPHGFAARRATIELIASHKILEQGKSLMFVPMFLEL